MMNLFIFFVLLYIPIFLFYLLVLLCLDLFMFEKQYINYQELMKRAFDFSIYIYILWCFLKYLATLGKANKDKENQK